MEVKMTLFMKKVTHPVKITMKMILVAVMTIFWVSMMNKLYRVIHKSLRDFRPLRYSSRDGHAEGSMSTEGETLQISVLPYRCSIC